MIKTAGYIICVFSALLPLTASAEISMDEAIEMRGFYGAYPISREASGTSWQPDTTPLPGTVTRFNDQTVLTYGFINGGYILQSGDRGEDEVFTTSIFSILGQHPAEDTVFGLRLRLSLDPLNGNEGYPLLLQSGSTSNGRDRLLDHQYGQDLITEFALTFSWPFSEGSGGFVYAGYPGQPALGPPDYLTRFSASSNPVAPITRRWLESTLMSYGVLTAGYTSDYFKFDASVFNAEEPDQSRWDFENEEPKFKSYSGRVAFNLTPILVWDFSVAHLSEPERAIWELMDENRVSSFLSWNIIGDGMAMQNSFGWGRNEKDPGPTTNAFLFESTVKVARRQTYFGRFEFAQADELFPRNDPRQEKAYDVFKAEFGYIHDFPLYGPSVWGIGAMVALNFLPQDLEQVYGERMPAEFLIFLRAKL